MKYYIKKHQKILGPMSMEQLKQYGPRSSTLIRVDNDTQWRPASQISGLESLIVRCPQIWLKETIFLVFFCPPFGIAELIRIFYIIHLYYQYRDAEARLQSQEAWRWIKIGLAVGAIVYLTLLCFHAASLLKIYINSHV